MSEPTFQIVRNGKVIGNFALSEVAAKLKDGTILPTDTYWTAGMTEWASVSGLGIIVSAMKPPARQSKHPDSRSAGPIPRQFSSALILPRRHSSDVSFGKFALLAVGLLFVISIISSLVFSGRKSGTSTEGDGFVRKLRTMDDDAKVRFRRDDGSSFEIEAGVLRSGFDQLARFGESLEPSHPREPTAAEKRAAEAAASTAAEAQRKAKFEGEIRSGVAALREGLSEADRIAAEAAEEHAKLEAEARAAQLAKAKSDELDRAIREAAESRRIETQFAARRRLLALESHLLSSAKKEAASWVAASANPEVRNRHESFIQAANHYLVAEIWPTTAEVDENGLTKDERDALSLAQRRVAATSQSSSSVKFTNGALNRRTTASGSTRFYHVWGELEVADNSGKRFVGQWSALLTKESEGVEQVGVADPAMDEVTDAWQSHVLVWDVKPKVK